MFYDAVKMENERVKWLPLSPALLLINADNLIHYQCKIAYKLTLGNRRLTHSRMNHQLIMQAGTRAVSYAIWRLWTHTHFSYTPFSFFTDTVFEQLY